MEFRIERLSAENIHLLVPLYRVVFNQAVSLSFLLKKYDTKFTGVQCVGFLALTSRGDASAFYGVIPCYFQLNGITIVAAQSADTMTHPDHRKKGLFQLLAHKTYELANDQDIKFIFGFPNQDSYPGFVKLRWKFLPRQLQVFSIKAGGVPYAPLLRRSRLLFSFYNGMVRRLLGDKKINPTFFENKESNGIKHDNNFCEYKTYNPSCVASISSVQAWIRADGKLKVGAINGLNEKNVNDFVNAITSIASKLGCNEVVLMTSKYSPLYNVLVKSLVAKDAFPVGYLPIENTFSIPDDITFDYCDVDIF